MKNKRNRLLTPAAALLLLVATLIGLVPAANAQTGGVLSREQLAALIDESSTALDKLRAARNQSVPTALANRDDRRGLTFKDDLRQNVFVPEVEARLTALKQTAASDLAAGDLPGAQLNLASLRKELAAEIERFKAITDYWKETGSLKPNASIPGWAARNEKLRSAGIEPAPHGAAAAAFETQFHEQIASREFASAMNATWPKYREAADLATAEESQSIISLLDKGELQALPSALPTKKCVPAKETSHAGAPKVRAREFPSSEHYVAKAARGGASGAVAHMIVVVDSRGCPERALLIGKSGSTVLDDGALRFMVDGYYFPAERDGVATRAAMLSGFKLDHAP